MSKENDTLLINLYAGPGCGKSSSMATIFSELKWLGVNCEMAPEFAKEKVWEKSTNILNNQVYVFGKQFNTIFRLEGQVDVIITDSPLLLSIIYGKDESPKFKDFVLEVFNRHDNMNFFLERLKEYNPKGRLQTFEEAKEKDKEIKNLLDSYYISYTVMEAKREVVIEIADMICEKLNDN